MKLVCTFCEDLGCRSCWPVREAMTCDLCKGVGCRACRDWGTVGVDDPYNYCEGDHDGADPCPDAAGIEMSTRQRCLETALKLTQTDRNSTYGNPEDNFSNIARYWNAHLQARNKDPYNLDATDVAIMMAAMKLARLSHNPAHEDSWVDLAGYAACGMEIALDE